MRVILVRHAQSVSNAGLPTADPVCAPLTALGREQAAALAASWRRAPSCIAKSGFVRVLQTAAPTEQRFAAVPSAVWPVQEFTYLQPARWIGSTRAQRRPAVEAFWRRGDPAYVDGPGAESFADVLHRAQAALERLAALPDEGEVVVFTHGQFMQALRQCVLHPQARAEQQMADFWEREQHQHFLNCQKVLLERVDGGWRWHEPGAGLL